MDMPPPCPHVPTSTKPENHHVLELPLATLRHPSTTPLLLAHSPARNRRSSAGQPHVEHLAGTPAPQPPQLTSACPSRPRPPRRAPRPPLTPLAPRPCLPHPARRRTSPPARHRAARGMAWPSRAPPLSRAAPPIKPPPRPRLTTPAPPLPTPSPLKPPKRSSGAPLRTARTSSRAAAVGHRRRRHRCPDAAQTTRSRPRPSPPSIAAGR